jgi:hypothetical protein
VNVKKINLLLIGLFCVNYLFSQDTPTAYPSPEAASLGIVGNIPVSYYTGKMNLSVPLLDLKADNYDMPISLSYNSSGFMPNLVNGWVGQNWTLNAGGVITRVVKGLPDESSQPVEYGFFYTWEHLSDINWYVERATGYPTGGTPRFDAEPDEFYFNVNGLTGKFYMNEQGTFTVISEPGVTVSIYPYENLKAVPNLIGGSTEKTFYGFDIKTMDGITYHFGFSDKLIETSSPGNGAHSAVASSWYLSEIVLAQQSERIQFSYSQKYFDIEKTITDTDNRLEWFSDHGATPCTDDPIGGNISYSFINHIYLKSIESSIYKVNFHTSDMNFHDYFSYAPFTPQHELTHHWQKLDSIVVTSKNPQRQIKKINFEYEIGKRAFLKSVQTLGMPPYQFEYYSENGNGKNPLTIGFDCRSIDHWGYYSGAKARMNNGREPQLLVSEFYFDSYIYHNIYHYPGREVDPDFVQTGMLKKVKYPTDGEKLFEYEPNEYFRYYVLFEEESLIERNVEWAWSEWKHIVLSNYPNGNTVFTPSNPAYLFITVSPHSSVYNVTYTQRFKTDTTPLTLSQILQWVELPENAPDLYYQVDIQYKEFQPSSKALAGGTRIKKITTAENSKTTIQEYKYVKNYSPSNNQNLSSGIVGAIPVYSFGRLLNREDASRDDFKPVVYNWVSRTSSSYTPLNLTQGTNVGYSEVTEITKTENGNTLGYTVYKYSNFDYFPNQVGIPIKPAYPAVHFFYNTDRLAKTDYDIFRGKLLNVTVYSNQNVIVGNTEYKYRTYNREPLNAIRFVYLPKTSCTAKEGSAIGAYDYSILNCSYLMESHLNCSYLMESQTETLYDANGKNPVVMTTNYNYNNYNQVIKSSVANSDGSIIETRYKYPADYNTLPYTDMVNNFNHLLSPVVEKSVYKNNIFVSKEKWDYKDFGNYLPEYYKVQYGTGSLETKVHYVEYDAYSNPLIIADNSGKQTIYLWTHGQFLQAIIQNATKEEVVQNLGNLQLGRNDPPDNEDVDALRPLLPNAQISTFRYMPMIGVVVMTDPRGIVSYYDYDQLNRLKETYYLENNTKKKKQTFNYQYKNN